MLERDAPPILRRDLDTRRESRSRTIEIVFADYHTAERVKGWLADAANRCETWDTAPLQPIR